MSGPTSEAVPCISVAVRAWNEEAVIRRTLESLMAQSLFAELRERGEHCEVICIPNGCTDRTAAVAAAFFAEQRRRHPFADAFTCRVAEMKEAGRNHTWNAFVHTFSHPQAEFLYPMDADIWFREPGTLFNMYMALRNNPQAQISSDFQIKDVALKKRKSLLDRLSLATSDMTQQIEGRITGQLYCIRAEVARRLWLPKDLGAPDDGFIKAVVCTDFFTRPLDPSRITPAPNASHLYEAYISPWDVLKNQKRQMIGQTTVHVLLEYVRSLPRQERQELAAHLKAKEAEDPAWLGRLTEQHARQRGFWRLFPNVLTFRWQRWWKLGGLRRVTHFPAALAGAGVTLMACAMARRHFLRGQIAYWPKASRTVLRESAFSATADLGKAGPAGATRAAGRQRNAPAKLAGLGLGGH
ncbi:MAG TPA: glycosyltransferase family A protein [Candidatus Acidoferrum sp.]|nr:glycosyltransferase family A protein [Candidatus Acidoferrum sp.]